MHVWVGSCPEMEWGRVSVRKPGFPLSFYAASPSLFSSSLRRAWTRREKKGVMRGVELRKAPPPFSYFPAFSTAALFFPGAILFSSPFLPSPGFSQAEKEKLKDEARVLAKGKGGGEK